MLLHPDKQDRQALNSVKKVRVNVPKVFIKTNWRSKVTMRVNRMLLIVALLAVGATGSAFFNNFIRDSGKKA